MQLDPIAVAAGVRLEALVSVGSTNKEARLRALRGDDAPLWITAVTQTQGRGRMDRSWASPPGNLYASLLLREPAAPERAPELGFVAALALRDAIIAEAPALASRLAFKWPNDLLLAGKKCAGILIEGDVGVDNRVNAVIGIGVNCASHPATPPIRRPILQPTAPPSIRSGYSGGFPPPCAAGLQSGTAGRLSPLFSATGCRGERPWRGDYRAQRFWRKARPLCWA